MDASKEDAPTAFLDRASRGTRGKRLFSITLEERLQQKMKIVSLSLQQKMKIGTLTMSCAHGSSDFSSGELEGKCLRLMKDMDLTVKQVEESKYYAELKDQLDTNEVLQQHIKLLLGPSLHMPMIIFALGSIELSYRSQYQLALAILLKRDYSHWIDRIEVFDPAFTPTDRIILMKLGCIVLSIDERCRRKVQNPTLFFMPYAYFYLLGTLVEAN